MKKLHLLDEGSWALMIEESNVAALQKYHGSMARLDIGYYLSIGIDRYYKGYFDEEELMRVRNRIVRFLLDDATYGRCVSEIHGVLRRMQDSDAAFATLDRFEQFQLYCDVLCDYIAYYNSVITDTFYLNVFDVVDAELPRETRFANKAIKDALFATDNTALLTHEQTVDMLSIARRHLDGRPVDEDIAGFVEKYRSTTISSGSPNGMTAAEVRSHLATQTATTVRTESAFLDNLHFRYRNSEAWSTRTAAEVCLSDETRVLVQRTSELSYLKIKMREEFQNFKVITRRRFLTGLIKEIGKHEFDYMRMSEIGDFIRTATRVPEAELSRRRTLTVFELKDDRVDLLSSIPPNVEREAHSSAPRALSGDVLIGAGTKRYRVKKVEQHEEGLNSFDEFIDNTDDKTDVAVITNVLRPYLVPKLRKFGALLTQYGGYTSHASVLCRELGINSMISVHGLLDAVATDDFIEVDFDRGTVRKLTDDGLTRSALTEIVVDLKGETTYTNRDVGTKAANLQRIHRSARIADGFVVTSHAMRNIDDPDVWAVVLDRLTALGCGRVVIRSSHESEDGSSGSFAGLFESYVDVDATDTDTVIRLAKSVYRSQRTDSIEKYAETDGDMSVIVQEMISADVSGVILSSNPFDGYDYLLFEYVVGDLSYLMQGDVTPIISYIRKVDIIDERETYHAYPAVITESLGDLFRSLARIAVDLEKQFSHRVQIEWGIKNDTIYVYQVRPY